MNMNIIGINSLFDLYSFFASHPSLYLFCLALFSIIIGSFLNVVVYRLPKILQQNWQEECRLYLGLKPHADKEKLSLSLPFSRCPACQQTLKPWHNIPVFSYLFLRGKCAYCTASISIRYPIIELITALTSVYLGWRFGLSWQTLAALFFTWILIALTFIDIDYYLLPDSLTLLLLWLGLFFSLFAVFCTTQDAILGAMLGYLIFALVEYFFHRITGKIGMGQGDFKLLAALGAFLGWQQLPVIILLASIIGTLFTSIQMLIKQQSKSIPLPFGPYLAVAGWICLLWGTEILATYWQWVH